MRTLGCSGAVLLTLPFLFGTATSPAAEPVDSGDDPADTQPATSQPAEKRETPFNFLENEQLTGDWWGARTWLKDRGIEFGLALTAIYQHNVRGGLQTRNGHRITGSADYELTLDTEGMGLWKGGTVYAGAESTWGDDIGGDLVGNLFGVNFDAAGNQAIRVYELWYEQRLFDDKLRIRFGRIDMRAELDTNAYANDETAQFINFALINTVNIPFPDYGFGALVLVQPWDWLYAAAGVADAQADGRTTGFHTAFHGEDYVFSDFEFGLLPVWKTPWGKLPGGYRFGLWYDPQPKAKYFNDLGGRRRTIPTKSGDTGFYVNLDQLILKERPADDADSQGLGVFFRYGFAHQDVNPIEHFWSIGCQYRGLIPTRDDDVLAFGVAQGVISDALRAFGGEGTHESIYELYYNIRLLPWLNLTPDFQYIDNSGGGGGRDAFVAGVRIQASF